MIRVSLNPSFRMTAQEMSTKSWLPAIIKGYLTPSLTTCDEYTYGLILGFIIHNYN